MYKKNLRYTLIVIVSILITSCASFEDIKIGDIQNLKVNGIEDNVIKIDVEVPVDNPTLFSFKITSVDIRTTVNGKYIGKLSLNEPIKVKSRRNENYLVPVDVKISNMFVTMFVMMNVKSGSSLKVKLEGTAQGQSMLIKKEYPIEEVIDIKL
ncbi:MAG: LEA type 2 family protein [Bacteroidales bacterium]|nr:LEA type 2 family protein [Bacteroidales bacterium]